MLIPILFGERQDPLAVMLAKRETEPEKFLSLDFAVLLRTTPSIYALLETFLIAVGFGSSFQLLSRSFSFRH